MTRIGLIIIIFAFFLNAQAQNTFNIILEEDTPLSQSGRTIYPLADSSFVLFSSNVSSETNQGISIYNISTNGNINWKKLYIDTVGSYFVGQNESFVQAENGNFVWGGTYATGGSVTGNYRLMKFDAQGDSLWTRSFGGDVYESGYRAFVTSEGNYMQLGITSSYGAGEYDAYIVKTDSLGNTLWETAVGYDADDWAVDAVALPNDRMLIGGSTDSYGDKRVSYFFYLKKDGEVEKELFIDNNHKGGTHFLLTQDKNIVYSITKDTLITPSQEYGTSMVIKMDTLGNQLWQLPFYSGAYSHVPNIEELADSSILVFGNTTETYNGNNFGWLARVSQDGELLWQKQYFYDDQTHNVFWDVEPTLDGGFIVTGRVNYGPTAIWLLKVNCEGELEDNPDCSSLVLSTANTKLEHRIRNLTVFPNPAYHQATVYWPHLKDRGNYQLHIYQADGRLRERIPIHADDTAYDLAVYDYAAGLYWVLLYDRGELVARSKLVVMD